MKYLFALLASALVSISALGQITILHYTVTPSNANPVQEIPAGKITLNFYDYSLIFCNENYINMTADNGITDRLQTWFEGGTRLSILVKEAYTKPGVYTFHFPQGSIWGEYNCNDEDELDAFDVIYTIEGENGIESTAADTAYDIYSLKGQPVATGANASILASIPRGLYIVNGKKTYLAN